MVRFTPTKAVSVRPSQYIQALLLFGLQEYQHRSIFDASLQGLAIVKITMAHYLELLGTAFALYLGSLFFGTVSERYRFSRAATQHACKPPRRYPHWEPFLGMDLFVLTRKADACGQCMQFYAKLHERYGATFEMKALNGTQVQIAQHENIQAVAATQFNDFGVGPLRGNIGAPFLDRGVFTEDGEFWKHSRALIRLTFNRAEIADLDAFERHVARFLRLIPRDGSTFDLQPLAKRLVCIFHVQSVQESNSNSFDIFL